MAGVPPANSYEILSRLAEGGMAELFLARVASASASRRYVVLKRIAKERAGDTQFVRMFLDEAKLAAQLRHPNIAQVYEIGRLGTSYFFTMEYVHGVTVHQLVTACAERRQGVPIATVLAVLSGTAAGLDHAHEKKAPDGSSLGIVHRDISPSNVLLSYEGHIKVVDFGIAKAHGRPETVAGEIKGKVGYMSPEQCRLQKLDRRSDLYSLGILGWEMLTAKRLWKRETAFGTMAAIATESAPLPSLYRGDLPPEVDKLIGKLLATEVRDRFQSAREVIDAIELVSQSTRTSIASPQLARLLRDLFGAPVEPWLAEDAPDVITVLTTPVPAELETLDDPALGVIEQKLTRSFPSVSASHEVVEDISTTNVLAVPRVPGLDDSLSTEDQTREVPALAMAPLATSLPRMTDIERAQQPPFGDDDDDDDDDAMSTIQASKREILDEMQTLAIEGKPEPKIDLGRTMLGSGDPRAPNRLPPPPSVPPPIRPSAAPIVPVTVIGPITAPPTGARGSAAGMAPMPRGSGVPITAAPLTMPGNVLTAGHVPTSIPTELPGSGPRSRVPSSGPRPSPDLRPSGPGYGSGPAAAIPGSGPQSGPYPPASGAYAPPRPSDAKLPRFPPPPHGDVRLLRWWILGGFALGVVITVVVLLATRSESPTETHDALVITATSPDANISVTPIADGAAGDAAASSDAPSPTDAAVAADAIAIDAPPPTKLRTKDALNAAFRAKQYKDIVAACKELGAVDDRANVCTLAACRAGDDIAQDWYRNLTPKQRKFALGNCAEFKHPIEDVCATDGICKQ